LTPVPGSKGGLKRRSIGRSKSDAAQKTGRAGREAAKDMEDDPDNEPGEEEATTSDDIYQNMTQEQQDKIRELIQRALQSGEKKLTPFIPPRGRRHHSVIYCPKRSQI
jgi:hypothetical protein